MYKIWAKALTEKTFWYSNGNTSLKQMQAP